MANRFEVSKCNVCGARDAALLFEKQGFRFVRCVECGLECISPQPSAETLDGIYGRHYYDAWGLHADETGVAALKKRTFRALFAALGAPSKGDKLLDCGAATGFLLEVARELGYEPYGLELTLFGAQAIAAKFGAERVYQGELLDARFTDAAPGDFRLVTMCDYIEHVRDPRQTLRCARAWLGPGGVLALTTPDTSSFSHRVLGHGWSHYRFEHLFYFDRQNLARLLTEVGFSSVRFLPLCKALSLAFVGHQLELNPHPLLTPLARVARNVLPKALASWPVRVPTGELFAVARVAERASGVEP